MIVKFIIFILRKVTSLIFFVVIFSSLVYSKEKVGSICELRESEFSRAVNLERYLPLGFSRKGDIDYTIYLQKGLDENKEVLIPNFPILINDNGLKINSGQRILFQEESQIRLKASLNERYQMLDIFNKSDIEIYYPNIVGDKYSHLGTSGQWGMGISIISSNDVFIYSPFITKCWGDAIYLGSKNGKDNINVFITKAKLDDNRRNGISIISGVNICISDAIIQNTSGQSPEAAIDIEPNTNAYRLKNINLINIKSINNQSYGLIISTGLLKGHNDAISINVDNFVDNKSAIGLALIVVKPKDESSKVDIHGEINVRNFSSFNNSEGKFRNYGGANHFVQINLDFKDDFSSVRVENMQDDVQNNKNLIIK